MLAATIITEPSTSSQSSPRGRKQDRNKYPGLKRPPVPPVASFRVFAPAKAVASCSSCLARAAAALPPMGEGVGWGLHFVRQPAGICMRLNVR